MSTDGGRFQTVAASYLIVGRNALDTSLEPIIAQCIARDTSAGLGGRVNDAVLHKTAFAVVPGFRDTDLFFLPANGADRLPIMAGTRFGAISPLRVKDFSAPIAWTS